MHQKKRIEDKKAIECSETRETAQKEAQRDKKRALRSIRAAIEVRKSGKQTPLKGFWRWLIHNSTDLITLFRRNLVYVT